MWWVWFNSIKMPLLGVAYHCSLLALGILSYLGPSHSQASSSGHVDVTIISFFISDLGKYSLFFLFFIVYKFYVHLS
jgi:hypothetical protein